MNDDFDTALFEPELILSPQMTEDAQDDGDTSGERALMLAILEDAMRCIERGRRRRHPRTRQLAAEAETWVRSDSREWLFSFASICDVLGIDPDAFRVRLLTPVGRPAIDARAARPEADEHGLRRFDEMLGAAAPAPEDLPALLGAHPGHVAVDALPDQLGCQL